MFSALLYLQFQSLRNNLLQRARRLRQPRYLFGALIGGGYLCLMFSRSFAAFWYDGAGRTAGRPPALFTGATPATWEFVFGLVLAVGALLVWVVPRQRAALVFTEAEIAFLFPAPVTRRTLICFKLVRSQVSVLFTVFFLTIISHGTSGLGGAFLRAVAWWLILSTVNLHLLGASFARTVLFDRGLSHWRRRALVLAVVGAAAGAAWWWSRGQIHAPGDADLLTPGTLAAYVARLADTAPARWLLAPFRVLVRPFVSSDHPELFWRAFWPALGLLGLHFLWVLRGDVAFEEASLESSRAHAAQAASLREGKGARRASARRRRAPFSLAPTGSPAVAILWKNLLGAGQFLNARLAVAVLVWSVAMGFGLNAGAGRTPWPQVIGFACLMILGWTLLLGPQFVRQDFRRDLALADLLKVYPLRGWQVALGELLTPALVLTVFQAALVLLAATLLGGHHAALISDTDADALAPPSPEAEAAAGHWLGFLPAWFAGVQAGGPRGIEVMGQRLIFFLAQFVALAVASLPAGLAFFLTYTLLADPFLPEALALPVSALAAALVYLAEGLGGVALLGHWFERYDLTAERPGGAD